MRIINGIEELEATVGQHLGYSERLDISQQRVNQFAEATGDDQWIHVDVTRAARRVPTAGRSRTDTSHSRSSRLWSARCTAWKADHQLRHRQGAVPGAGAGGGPG